MVSFWKWLLGWEVGEVVRADWRLRFVAEIPNWLKLVLMVVFAALAYLTIRSYRREGEAPRRAKAVLAAIRLAVLALVFAIILQPAIVLRYVNSLTSSVVLLIDDSQSMSFTDRYADPNVADMQARLAKALNVPEANLPDMKRSQIAQQLLSRPGGPLFRLAADHEVEVVRYSMPVPSGGAAGSYTRAMGTVNLVQREGSGIVPADRSDANVSLRGMFSRLGAAGYSTNPAAGIRGALDLMQGRRVAAIIHVWEGQMTVAGGGSAIAGALDYARERGVPLYEVLVGDPTPPRNVAVISLGAPREVRRAAEVEFTVNLANRNMGGQPVTVQLQRRRIKEEVWSDTLASEAVTMERPSGDPNLPSGTLQSVVIRYRPDELGEYEYRAKIDPRSDEENKFDNIALAAVRVVEEKIRVLLVSGNASKEFQYFRNHIQRNEDEYLVSVWQQNAEPEVNQSASSGMKLERLPQALDELIGVPGDPKKPGYNVVILYDPYKEQGGFDKHFVEDLLQPFVKLHHGGLCYVAGHKYTDLLLDGKDKDFEALQKMMPVFIAPDPLSDISRIGETHPEPWQVRLTAYGMDHPITRLAGPAEDSQEVWEFLPGIYWSHPVVRPKPMARVLAASSDPMRRMVGKNEPLPLIVTQPYGQGTVLYVGFDETWRWMPLRDGHYHRVFWSNVVRYLSSLQARRVNVSAGGSRFTIGEDITVEVQAYDAEYQPLVQEAVDVDLVQAGTGEKELRLSLKRVEDKDKQGLYRGNFTARQKGHYQLVANLDTGDPNEGPAFKAIEIDLPREEFLRTEADPQLMRSMAWPQDKFMDITQLDRLGEIPAGRWTSTREVPKYLWDTNLMLSLIVVLLAAEWILRKKYNMA